MRLSVSRTGSLYIHESVSSTNHIHPAKGQSANQKWQNISNVYADQHTFISCDSEKSSCVRYIRNHPEMSCPDGWCSCFWVTFIRKIKSLARLCIVSSHAHVLQSACVKHVTKWQMCVCRVSCVVMSRRCHFQRWSQMDMKECFRPYGVWELNAKDYGSHQMPGVLSNLWSLRLLTEESSGVRRQKPESFRLFSSGRLIDLWITGHHDVLMKLWHHSHDN